MKYNNIPLTNVLLHYMVLCMLFGIIVASVVGCSFDYTQANIEEELDENIPDIILKNAKLVFVRGTSVIIESDLIEIYSSQKQQLMNNVRFREITREEEIRMQGSATQISIETDTHDITMVGEVFARSHNDEAEVETEYLHWNDEKRIISGSAISPVTIKKDIGSNISGYGFIGNAETRKLSISGSVQGQLVVEEEDEGEGEQEDEQVDEGEQEDEQVLEGEGI